MTSGSRSSWVRSVGAWVSVALILGGSLGGPEGSGGGHSLSCEGCGARATARARRTRTPINTIRAIRDSSPPAIAPSQGDNGKSPPEAVKINNISIKIDVCFWVIFFYRRQLECSSDLWSECEKWSKTSRVGASKIISVVIISLETLGIGGRAKSTVNSFRIHVTWRSKPQSISWGRLLASRKNHRDLPLRRKTLEDREFTLRFETV